jgi:hypothetical protein
MSTKQWLRKASLIVGSTGGLALDLSALRFTFHIARGDVETPNSARIRVYNVSDDTAHQAGSKEFNRVVIQAGYDGNYGVIFDGSIVQARKGRETPTDTYLDITAADGDMAYNFAVVNTTLAAGSVAADQVQVCTQAMAQFDVSTGYTPPMTTNRLPRAKVMFGMARNYMRAVADTQQMLWSIQDGKLQMVPSTSYVPGTIPVINAATGMIGMPQQTQNGINVKMLLNPMVRIGGLIKLDNSSIQKTDYSLRLGDQAENANAQLQNKINGDGLYYVMTNSQSGDTRGNDWYTEVVCLAVDATLAPSGLDLATKATNVSGVVPPKVINPWG